jgi:hypothetical protein
MTATHAGTLADAVAAAAAGGAALGRSAASWTFDGDTDRGTYRKCLDLDEEGDPAWDDLFGARPPLSGEWAGDPTPATVLAEYGGPGLDDEAIVTAYEDAYYEAYREAVLATARYHTEGN